MLLLCEALLSRQGMLLELRDGHSSLSSVECNTSESVCRGAGEVVVRQLSQAEESERSQPLALEPELELEMEAVFELRRRWEAPATPKRDSRRMSAGLDSDASVLRRGADASGAEARDWASRRLPTARLRLSSVSVRCMAASQCDGSVVLCDDKLWDKADERRVERPSWDG